MDDREVVLVKRYTYYRREYVDYFRRDMSGNCRCLLSKAPKEVLELMEIAKPIKSTFGESYKEVTRYYRKVLKDAE